MKSDINAWLSRVLALAKAHPKVLSDKYLEIDVIEVTSVRDDTAGLMLFNIRDGIPVQVGGDTFGSRCIS